MQNINTTMNNSSLCSLPGKPFSMNDIMKVVILATIRIAVGGVD